MKTISAFLISTLLVVLGNCTPEKSPGKPDDGTKDSTKTDSVVVEIPEVPMLTPGDIVIEKALLYDKYTLEDTYKYKDKERSFQWDKMREEIVKVENTQRNPVEWGVLQNRRNVNGEAPLVKVFGRNKHTRVIDSLGTEKYQSAPLYLLTDTVVPEIYGRDGSLVKIIGEEGSFTHIEMVYYNSTWMVPTKYVKPLGSFRIDKYAFVDRKDQNIATIERDSTGWVVRSMNPATTGLDKPPYQQETPLGIFVVQEKKEKMYYLVDGTNDIAGFSPHASRFCCGAYIHGVPVNLPRKTIIEWSSSLGTTPRSHMCVRNASSHAEFVYNWAPVGQSLVVVID